MKILNQILSKFFQAQPDVKRKAVATHTENYAFISYSRSDTLVEQFTSFLNQEELPYWKDNHLELGETWETQIADRIRGCTVFVIIMTPNSRKSEYVNRELVLAIHERKLVIPVLLSGEPFVELKDIHFIKLQDIWCLNTELVERLRDLLCPEQIPTITLQKRRVEYLVLLIFERSLGSTPDVRIVYGISAKTVFGVDLNTSLDELDELDWVEIFLILGHQFPKQDFHPKMGINYSERYPAIRDFANYLYSILSWEEIRKINMRFFSYAK